jgi:hypothetical protein
MRWLIPERRLPEEQLAIIRECTHPCGDHLWITTSDISNSLKGLLLQIASHVKNSLHNAKICLAAHSSLLKEMIAYSGPNWTVIPVQSGQPFRSKLDSDSGPNWTPIPV